MKIAIIGYSGSGKSTLARALGTRCGLPVLHLDRVQFLPGWEVRGRDEQAAAVEAFLDTHDGWVVDGNYTGLSYERRLREADRIVLLLFPRLVCLARVIRRYRRYRGQSRPDMTEGCKEKLDAAFVRWVLWEGRSRKTRQRYARIQREYADKVAVLRSQRALDAFLRETEL